MIKCLQWVGRLSEFNIGFLVMFNEGYGEILNDEATYMPLQIFLSFFIMSNMVRVWILGLFRFIDISYFHRVL